MATRTGAAPSAQTIKQTITLEPNGDAPGALIEAPPSFWERIYAITPDEWAGKYFCYLYRGQRGASLEKITFRFDPEWVRLKYGGGDYRALLNDENYKMVASHSFSIDGAPKLSPNEAQTSAPAAPAVDSFQTSVLEIIRESQKEMREMVRELASSVRNPAPATTGEANPILLKGVVDMFTGMMPRQTDPLDLLIKLKEMTKPVEQMDMLTMLTKAKELGLIGGAAAAAGGGTDLLSQVDSLLAVAEKLGARAGKDPSIMSILAEKAPEIMSKVGDIVSGWGRIAEANKVAEQYRHARATTVARAAGAEEITPQQPALNDPRAVAMPTHVPPGSAPGLELEPVGTAAATQTYSAQPAGAVAPLDEIDQMKRRIVRAIATEATGADIVSFMSIFDERLVDSFAGVNVEQLEAFFATDPILQGATQHPRFKECMREIVEVLEDQGALGGQVN